MDAYPEPYECLAAQILQQEKDVTIQGWMKKKSGRKKLTYSPTGLYDKRYFIILKGWVYYYKEPTSQNPQGCFSLEGYSSRIVAAEEEKSTSLPHVFKLFPRSKVGRTWFFVPDSKVAMDKWIKAFKKEIEQYNNYPGSSLRGSQSLPDKFRPNRPNNLTDPRTRSTNAKKNSRGVGNNSLESSCNTSSGGSMISVTSDYYDDLDSDQGDYESLDKPQDHTMQSYLGVDDINHPADLPYSENNPSGWKGGSRTQKPITQFRKLSPLPAIPNSPVSPRIPTLDFLEELEVPVYDTIDENEILPEQTFRFPKPPIPPVLPSRPKPHLPLCPKEKFSRDSSFPVHCPPKPPNMMTSQGYHEELNVSTKQRQDTCFHDKPLPPLPQEDNLSETRSVAEEFNSSGRSSPELYSNVFEDETINSSKLSEEDHERTYEDTVVLDEDSRNQFHQSLTSPRGNFNPKNIPVLPNRPHNKPSSLSPNAPKTSVDVLKPVTTAKPVPPLKPKTPSKPPTALKPVKTVNSSTSKHQPPAKPSVALKPKKQTNSPLTTNQPDILSSHDAGPSFSSTANKFGKNKTVSSNFSSTDVTHNPQTFGFKLPDPSNCKIKALSYETFSPNAHMAALLSKTAATPVNPRIVSGSTATANKDAQSHDCESADPSSASFSAKAKLFGERNVSVKPSNDSSSVSAKAFDTNSAGRLEQQAVSSKPHVPRKPYPR